jgi:hypothetical protein
VSPIWFLVLKGLYIYRHKNYEILTVKIEKIEKILKAINMPRKTKVGRS